MGVVVVYVLNSGHKLNTDTVCNVILLVNVMVAMYTSERC